MREKGRKKLRRVKYAAIVEMTKPSEIIDRAETSHV